MAWGNTSILSNGSFSQEIKLVHPVTSTTASGSFGMIGREAVSTRYEDTKYQVKIALGGNELGTISWANLGLKSGEFTIPADGLNHGTQTFQITNISNNPNSEPLIDYISLKYTRKLIYTAPFEIYPSIKDNDMTFLFTGSNLKVWNITKLASPENVPVTPDNDNTKIRVSLPADTLQRFIVFKLNDLMLRLRQTKYLGKK